MIGYKRKFGFKSKAIELKNVCFVAAGDAAHGMEIQVAIDGVGYYLTLTEPERELLIKSLSRTKLEV